VTTVRPDLGCCVSGIATDEYIVSVAPEGAAGDAGLLNGDVIVSLDGLSLAELRASAWWRKPIKVVYQRRSMTLRGNFVVHVFDAPPVSVPIDDAPALTQLPFLEVGLIPADGDFLPSRFPPDNAETFAQTFGRPIGDQSWRYGRHAGVSDYGGCIASPTPMAMPTIGATSRRGARRRRARAWRRYVASGILGPRMLNPEEGEGQGGCIRCNS
jgi:hypothetical protein